MLSLVRAVMVKRPRVKVKLSDRALSTDLSAALRPFYFAVHPDLFAQFPLQRRVNEDSLKQLSDILDCIQARRFHVLSDKRTLRFYIRTSQQTVQRDQFKLVTVNLDCRQQKFHDARFVIKHVLEAAELPTSSLKNVKPPKASPNAASSSSVGFDFKPGQDINYGEEFTEFASNFYQAREQQKTTLDAWIGPNAALAKERVAELASLREEVQKLQQEVVQRLELKDARYDCGWNYEHYRGCLKSLERMADLHADHMEVLKGRVVVFAPFTGVSLEGHIMLFTGDVINNWIDFVKNIPMHDAFRKKVPMYENTLSQVLRNIKVGRRKFMPKCQAKEYAGHLLKVTTTIGDYLSKSKFPESWPESLSHYEIVIESEAGPLMVSPTGQLIMPSTCPGFMLVDFITTNLKLARELNATYQEEKQVEKTLVLRCMRELNLTALTKDDSVTPSRMIDSLTHLLEFKGEVFRDVNLRISNYYSVLADGVICIPWDHFAKRSY